LTAQLDKTQESVHRPNIHYVSKNIPDIFDCNLKINYQMLIIFGRNISYKTCHQMII